MASTYLTRTPSSNGSETKSTLSMWFKRSNISSQQTLYYSTSDNTDNKMIIRFNADDTFDVRGKVGGSFPLDIKTNRVFRDTSAWMNFVLKFDTTQATAADRFKMYVNGVQETSFSTETYPSQNTNLSMNQTNDQLWVGAEYGSGTYFDGLITHTHWTDGYAYDASAFGEFDALTGIWKAKTAPSVTYGNNGFFLKFENSGSMGLDSSPNGNNLTVNGTLTQTVDTPSNVFATFNPLAVWRGQTASPSQALFNGNTTYNNVPLGNDSYMSYGVSTLGVTKGKWYCEAKVGTITRLWLGVNNSTLLDYTTPINTTPAYTSFGWYGNNGNMDSSSSYSTGAFGGYVTDDILMFALDMDNYKFYVGKNGTWLNSGDPTSGATGTGSATEELTGSSATLTDYGEVFFFAGDNSVAGSASVFYNFGNGYFGTTPVSSATSDESGLGIFEYTVPSGYYALCTKNINTQG